MSYSPFGICLTTAHVIRGQIIAASPYTPAIYTYSDSIPTIYYEDFAELAGCGRNCSQTSKYPSVFDCLVAADSEVLQNASGAVSTTHGYFGSFAFLPVVDGDYIQQRPSVQLSLGQVSGQRILVGVSTHTAASQESFPC